METDRGITDSMNTLNQYAEKTARPRRLPNLHGTQPNGYTQAHADHDNLKKLEKDFPGLFNQVRLPTPKPARVDLSEYIWGACFGTIVIWIFYLFG